MRIDEIEYGHWTSPSLPEDQTINDAELIGYFDGYDIYRVNDYLMVLDDQNLYMGYIRIAAGSSTDLIFKEVFVPVKNRRRGIATILVLFVLRDLKRRLVLSADEIVTDDSRQLFYNLLKINKIKITNNGKSLDLSEFGKICSDVEDNDLTLIIENSYHRKKSLTCYEIRNPDKNNQASIPEARFGNFTREAMWFD